MDAHALRRGRRVHPLPGGEGRYREIGRYRGDIGEIWVIGAYILFQVALYKSLDFGDRGGARLRVRDRDRVS